MLCEHCEEGEGKVRGWDVLGEVPDTVLFHRPFPEKGIFHKEAVDVMTNHSLP